MKNCFWGRIVGLGLLLGAAVLAGCSPPSFVVTPIFGSRDLREVTVKPADAAFAPKVAVIEVEGLLMAGRAGGLLGGGGSNPIADLEEKLTRAANDKAVKAVVLRINSPGGGVTASDIMHQRVAAFKAETGKPVIASSQDVCASGAYLVAMAADELIVQETSIVGSVGVIFTTVEISSLMSKVGVTANVIKSGPRKDMGSPLRAMTPEDRQVLQDLVDEYYGRFKGSVAGRYPQAAQDDPQFAQSTDGRVFSGAKAVELGLADRTGTLEDAVDRAKELAGVKSAKVIMYRSSLRSGGAEQSLYASSPVAPPDGQTPGTLKLELTDSLSRQPPAGFWYLWLP